jgi:superoxide dismutase, Cu-Zn family
MAQQSNESISEAEKELICTLTPTEGNQVMGEITFIKKSDDAVEVTIIVGGLEPGSTHAIHIHEFGDLSKRDGSSAGGHFNPADQPHGLLDNINRHAGDLGNISANDKGLASKVLVIENISLSYENNSVLGRSVVVHAEKDTGTQPSGDAGSRVAVGVIGIRKR